MDKLNVELPKLDHSLVFTAISSADDYFEASSAGVYGKGKNERLIIPFLLTSLLFNVHEPLFLLPVANEDLWQLQRRFRHRAQCQTILFAKKHAFFGYINRSCIQPLDA